MTSTTSTATTVMKVSATDWRVRGTVAFCWAVWATLLAMALYFLVTRVSNIPMSEDWLMVPPLAGLEKHFGAWLWEQNNEHRVPLPKLILLAILKLTGGSFKTAMLANIAFLAAISAGMMVAVWSARRGRARFSDAFFPVIFLNVGHWENMFWAWQMAFVLSAVLGCIPLVVLAARRPLKTVSALWIGASLIAMPLCGASGLLLIPVLTMWAAYAGLTLLRTDGRNLAGWILLASPILTFAVCGLYFVGYTRPSWTGPATTVAHTLVASLQFLALAFGPVARSAWMLSVPLTLLIVLVTAQCLTAALRRADNAERLRVSGLVAFFLTALFNAAAMGYGRAAVIGTASYLAFPLRYCLLAVPLLCVAYIAIDQFGSGDLKRYLPQALCAAACVLMPLNIGQGRAWARVFEPSITGIYDDIRLGRSSEEIANRYNEFLVHWKTPEEVAELVRLAHRANISPFLSMKEEPDPHPPNGFVLRPQQSFRKYEIRCHIPAATRVVLIWGVAGWKWLPKPWVPDDTTTNGGVMHTTMKQDGDWFQTTLAIPEGEHIDYGFQIAGRGDSANHPTWLAGAETAQIPPLSPIIEIPVKASIDTDGTPVVQTSGTPLPYQIRYHAPSASEVRFHWGIDGWHAVPLNLRPRNTEMIEGLMTMPMLRERDTFVTNVLVPAHSTIDYGFTILRRTGILNLLGPVWDGKPEYHAVVGEAGLVTVRGPARLGLEWVESIPPLTFWGRFAAVFAGIWAALFAALSEFLIRAGWFNQPFRC